MRRTSTIVLGLLAALPGLVGCASEVGNCDPVTGMFQPLYTLVQTNCGAELAQPQPHLVNLDGGNSGVIMNSRTMANEEITEEIVYKGCTMRMTQRVVREGIVRTEVDGASLSIENDEMVSGMVTVTQFDGLQNVVCQGTYQAEFIKDGGQTGAGTNGIIGAAAR